MGHPNLRHNLAKYSDQFLNSLTGTVSGEFATKQLITKHPITVIASNYNASLHYTRRRINVTETCVVCRLVCWRTVNILNIKYGDANLWYQQQWLSLSYISVRTNHVINCIDNWKSVFAMQQHQTIAMFSVCFLTYTFCKVV